jgi:hypothetical protein
MVALLHETNANDPMASKAAAMIWLTKAEIALGLGEGTIYL